MSSKEKTLDLYLKYQRCNLHPQGSEQWHKNRIKSIGCSEHRKATGTKSSKTQLVKNKIFPCSLNHVQAIQWGNIMEDTTKYLCELFLDVKINDCPGSIKSLDKVVTCSPDGLAVCSFPHQLSMLILHNIIHKPEYREIKKRYRGYSKIEDGEFVKNEILTFTVLFEFKTPFSRKLTDEISSEDYSRQVLMGLDCLICSDVGIFYEADIKSCNLEDLWFSETYYGCENKAIGIKYFIMLSENNAEMTQISRNSLSQLGELGKDYITAESPIFKKLNGKIKLKYNYTCAVPELEELIDFEITRESVLEFYNKFNKIMHARGAVYFMPWVLNQDQMFMFPKHENLGKRWIDECREVLQIVDKIAVSPEEDQRDAVQNIEFSL
tara:strand:+ start:634 stop:1773 length:1140 start_codon:yes stop_codon:yes gene_type:complete